MTRVFLPTPLRKDVLNLTSFGQIEVLMPSSGILLQETMKTVRHALREHHFDPATDFVVLGGVQIAAVALVAVALEDYDFVRVLVFDAKTQSYSPQIATHED